MDVFQLIIVLLKVSIAATVFGYGLHARSDEVLHLVRRPRVQIVSLLAMFVVTPTIALVLATALDVPLVAEVAVVALAFSPVPALLAKTEREAGGEMSYGIGLTVTAAVFSVVITPALVAFLGRLVDRPYEASSVQVGGIVLAEVLLPLVVGVVFRTLLPHVAERIREPQRGLRTSSLRSLAWLFSSSRYPWSGTSWGWAPSRCSWPSAWQRSASATLWVDPNGSTR
jgi:bile acid:Na+ symporter, BASS family